MVETDIARILVVDDEPIFQRSLEQLLKTQRFEVFTAASFDEAKQILLKENIHVVILDLVLPDRSGMDLLSLIKQRHQNTEVIVLTGYGSIDSAVEATKKGAHAYLPKPFEKEVLNISIRNALQTARLKTENSLLKDSLRKEYHFENIIGASAAMQKIFRKIEKIAGSYSTILLTGESGTGKELIAKAIHFRSERSKYHLVPINCGAIPEDLLESELFGHVKGAFTGAVSNRIGRFETAHQGTIFLDEIGDTPLSIQVKLLRVLQEKSFEPVGSSKKVEVDVRIIAATNQKLKELIAKKQFREDLFYRLNVIPIDLPSLRERKEDIPLLLRFFNQRFCQRQKRSAIDFDSNVLQTLIDYPWPGNVRELENLVEQLVVFSEGKKITIQDLPRRFTQNRSTQTFSVSKSMLNPILTQVPDSGIHFNQQVDQFERRLILEALESTNWNKNQAAKLLNLNRTTLVEKMKKKRIQKEEDVVAEA